MSTEIYATTVELPGVGDVDVTVKVFRGHQGGRVLRQTIVAGTYADGVDLSSADRARAHALLPDLD